MKLSHDLHSFDARFALAKRLAIALFVSACLLGQQAQGGEKTTYAASDFLVEMSNRLLLLQSELTKDDSSRLNAYLEDAHVGRYAPGIYLALLRIPSPQDDAQLRDDLEFAVSAGVANAAIIYGALRQVEPGTKGRDAAYRMQAADLLSQFEPEESWLVPLMSYLVKKRGSVQEPLAEKELASQLYRSAATGSPLANSLLLRVHGQNRKLSAMACGFLTIAKVWSLEFPCGESDRQYIRDLETLAAERALQLEREYAGHYEFYRNGLCDRLSGAAKNPSICNDLLSTALNVCRLRIDATHKDLAPVSGLFVCNRQGLQAVRDMVEPVYEESFSVTIFGNGGGPELP